MSEALLWTLLVLNACAIAGLVAMVARSLVKTDYSRYVPPLVVDVDLRDVADIPVQRAAPAGRPLLQPHAVPAD